MANSTIKAEVSESINSGVTNFYITKYGKIVTISFTLDSQTYTTAGWKTIATLPAEARPKATVNFSCFDGNAGTYSDSKVLQGRVNTDGTVNVWAFSDKLSFRPYGYATFISAI